jgi:hypothetical protein
MVRAVAPVAQNRMTRPFVNIPRSSPEGGGLGRLRDPRVACLRQVKKEESRWRGSPAARLSSSRVDWPAQPSLDLAQNYFSRISWIVSIVLL